MSRYIDSDYLKNKQYADSANLRARIRLHQLFNTNKYEFQRWVFDFMLQGAPERCCLLELGGGNGELWRKNAERIPKSWLVTISDFSPGMLEDARKNLEEAGAGFDFRVIDAQDIPFADNTLDMVLAHFMLYHVPDRGRAIREIRRVLKPDGYFYAATLGAAHLRELHQLAHSVDPAAFPDRDNADRLFGLENGAEQLKAAFGDVRITRYDCDLEVTELPPLLDYLRSWISIPNLDDKRLSDFQTMAQEMLNRDGSIHITKDTGLFIARGYAGEAS